MGEKVGKTNWDYKEGYLHYCKKEGGKIVVYRAKMKHGGKKKKR